MGCSPVHGGDSPGWMHPRRGGGLHRAPRPGGGQGGPRARPRDAGPQLGTRVQGLAELEPQGRQDRVHRGRLRGGQADGRRGSRRWTTRDFVAKDAEWTSEDTLAILGAAASSGADDSPNSLYRARAGEDSLQLGGRGRRSRRSARAGEGLIFALERGTSESGLALTRGQWRKSTGSTPSLIEGRVTALSLSPDGDEAVLAVRPPGDPETSGLHVFDLRKGKDRR